MGGLLEALKVIIAAPFKFKYSLCLNALQLCIDLKAKKEGLLVHQHLITSGSFLDIPLGTKLIIFYAKICSMVAAHNIFDRMFERSMGSWNGLLFGYSQNGNFRDALMTFLAMHQASVKTNQFTYGSVLRACTGMRYLDGGKQIQGCAQKIGLVDNLFVQNALIDMHAKCGKMEDACYIFNIMSERNLVSWNAMVGGYAVQGSTDYSFLFFRTMLRAGMVPDYFTLGSVLRCPSSVTDLIMISQTHVFIIHLGYSSRSDIAGSLVNAYAECRSIKNAIHLFKNMNTKDLISFTSLLSGPECRASLNFGRQVHALASKIHAKFDVAMGNALIDMYAKSGEIQDATLAFDVMEDRNIISWTSLIAGYGMHGYGLEAIKLYKSMEDHGFEPNDVTFLCLIFSCSHAGLVCEGRECFDAMVNKYRILPRAEHYACMVDLFARGGQFEEAHEMMDKVRGMPDASTWEVILGACMTYGNISLGEVAARHIIDMEPNNPSNYVALRSIYAAAGSWGNAVSIQRSIGMQFKKDPGYSMSV